MNSKKKPEIWLPGPPPLISDSWYCAVCKKGIDDEDEEEDQVHICRCGAWMHERCKDLVQSVQDLYWHQKKQKVSYQRIPCLKILLPPTSLDATSIRNQTMNQLGGR